MSSKVTSRYIGGRGGQNDNYSVTYFLNDLNPQ